ncbi:uncharacterized protein FIBRA_08885 [Fibroporia radiculosa]|uniref:Uncharacterized protein n=1 Tax=Fibroporia radiculosa TaxID=599839 RepID=J4ICL2_9APHY|nr:uncharacterized protein FIBRA_08885 [Fibroporia radiculosa]CCM06606.1 predicted protein [Fibroporia radiculosa]
MQASRPIVDEKNPFYCPSLSAATFLENVRLQFCCEDPPPYTRTAAESLPSFPERLHQSLDETDIFKLLCDGPPISTEDETPEYSSVLHSACLVPQCGSTPIIHSNRVVQNRLGAKRKRSISADTFSELLAPPKRERSSQSVNDASFELSAKAGRIRYFGASSDTYVSPFSNETLYRTRSSYGDMTKAKMGRRLRALEDELYGYPVGTETPRGIKSLVARLDVLLPGIRLKERLYALDIITHQRIAEVLAVDGHLNARILEMLRTSEIACLDLTASLMDEEGLNMGAHEVLQVFEKQNSFQFLAELNLGDAVLEDVDIVSLHRLPRLTRLSLSNTGIGNEAVFILVSLKRTLAELDIAFNPRIDDDAIPALLALPKLSFLSLFETGVQISGLRRFAMTLRTRKRQTLVGFEAPRECEEYVEDLHRKRMLYPRPPLIVNPIECSRLSPTALRRNLAEHAVFDASVVVGGSDAEMVERLERILTIREMDLAVRELIWHGQQKNGIVQESEDESEDHCSNA